MFKFFKKIFGKKAERPAPHVSVLAAYCSAYERWVEEEKLLKNEPGVISTPRGYKYANPRLEVVKKLRKELVELAAELGLTPLSRKNVNRK